MSDQTRTNERAQASARGACGGSRGRKTRLGITAAALLGIGALLGAAATVALDASAHGRGWGHRGGHGAASGERMLERAQHRVGHLLERIDASEAQEQRIRAVVAELVEQLAPMHAEHRANRRDFAAELLRDGVDRGRLEQLRQAEVGLADAASARIVDALVEVGDVLTPEQREQLLAHFSTRHRH